MGFESQYWFLLFGFDILIQKSGNTVPAGLVSETPAWLAREDSWCRCEDLEPMLLNAVSSMEVSGIKTYFSFQNCFGMGGTAPRQNMCLPF